SRPFHPQYLFHSRGQASPPAWHLRNRWRGRGLEKNSARDSLEHRTTRARVMSLNDLPAVNAVLNGLASVFLTAGFIFIRRKNKIAHRNCMLSAVGCSALFLASYLTYHFGVHGVTKFKDPTWFRPFYFAILFSHLVLAIVILPMIIITLN